MKKLIRKESNVSKDFKETLKTVVRISGIDCSENNNYLNGSTDSSVNYSIYSRSSSSVSRKDIIDWKSINDSDVNSKIITQFAESAIREKNGKTNQLKENSKRKEITLKSESEKCSSTDSKEKQSKAPVLQRLFSFSSEIPFETTSITNLPFVLPIRRQNHEILNVKVCSHFTINEVINKVSKKLSCDSKSIALFYKNTRLERHITLSWYNITINSHVKMKILKKVQYYGSFQNQIYPISIFTSEKVLEIKQLFSNEISHNPHLLELKYKDIDLNDNRQFFLYDIPEGSKIDVFKKKDSVTDGSPDNMDYGKSPGYEFTQCFLAITSNLKQCRCVELRYESMTCGFLSSHDESYKKHKCLKYLDIFLKNEHLPSCSKSKTSPSTNIKNDPDSEVFFDEKSLNESIHAEIDNIDLNQIQKTDLEYLCQCKNFKAFKHFLRNKIGTKCDKTSVSMLYHYAETLVKFLNSICESDEMIIKMLDYIRRYFRKYFEKPIIARGGLINFARKESTSNQ